MKNIEGQTDLFYQPEKNDISIELFEKKEGVTPLTFDEFVADVKKYLPKNSDIPMAKWYEKERIEGKHVRWPKRPQDKFKTFRNKEGEWESWSWKIFGRFEKQRMPYEEFKKEVSSLFKQQNSEEKITDLYKWYQKSRKDWSKEEVWPNDPKKVYGDKFKGYKDLLGIE